MIQQKQGKSEQERLNFSGDALNEERSARRPQLVACVCARSIGTQLPYRLLEPRESCTICSSQF